MRPWCSATSGCKISRRRRFKAASVPASSCFNETAVSDYVGSHDGSKTTVSPFLGHASPMSLEDAVKGDIVLAPFCVCLSRLLPDWVKLRILSNARSRPAHMR